MADNLPPTTVRVRMKFPSASQPLPPPDFPTHTRTPARDRPESPLLLILIHLILQLSFFSTPVLPMRIVSCPLDMPTSSADSLPLLVYTNHTFATINVFQSCESYAFCGVGTNSTTTTKQCIPPYTSCGVCDAFSVTSFDPYVLVTVSKSQPAMVLLISGDVYCKIAVDPTTQQPQSRSFFFGSDGCSPLPCSTHVSCSRCLLQSNCDWCGAAGCVASGAATALNSSCVTDPAQCTPTRVTDRPVNTEGGWSRTATVIGDKLHTWDGQKWVSLSYVLGANLGASTPGYFPGELRIPYADYMSFFQYMVDAHMLAFRIYTIHPPHFYKALYDFNKGRVQPLYLFQGVWSPEEELINNNLGADAFSGNITQVFRGSISQAIRAVHGDLELPDGAQSVSGVYSFDVSPYVLGWILGTEWHQLAVNVTNRLHPNMSALIVDDPLYQWNSTAFGRPFQYIQPSDHAKPFEIWLALVMEYAARLDMLYGWQRPLAVTNWVTDDPIYHPLEPFFASEDLVTLNVAAIRATYRFTAGYFLAFHVYPYYPDAISLEYSHCAGCSGSPDSYAGYLAHLKSQLAGLCVLITEYGAPTSRGRARRNAEGRNQGGMTESEQGRAVVDMTRIIMELGYAGGLLFAFVDEWFKKSWNTVGLDNENTRAWWLNTLTSETGFGLLAAEPARALTLDGLTADWAARVAGNTATACALSAGDNVRATVSHDEGYLYVLLERQDGLAFEWGRDTVFIGLDSIPNAGSTHPDLCPAPFSSGLESLVVLNGNDSASFMIKADYDLLYYWFGSTEEPIGLNTTLEGINQTDHFNEARMIEVGAFNSDCKHYPAGIYPVGKLTHGSTDRASPLFNSQADWFSAGPIIELRIPWMLAGITDPPNRAAAPYPIVNKVQLPVEISGVSLQVMLATTGASSVTQSCAYSWPKWTPNDVSYRIRPKQSYAMWVAEVAQLSSSPPTCAQTVSLTCQTQLSPGCAATHAYDTPSALVWTRDNTPLPLSFSSSSSSPPSLSSSSATCLSSGSASGNMLYRSSYSSSSTTVVVVAAAAGVVVVAGLSVLLVLLCRRSGREGEQGTGAEKAYRAHERQQQTDAEQQEALVGGRANHHVEAQHTRTERHR